MLAGQIGQPGALGRIHRSDHTADDHRRCDRSADGGPQPPLSVDRPAPPLRDSLLLFFAQPPGHDVRLRLLPLCLELIGPGGVEEALIGSQRIALKARQARRLRNLKHVARLRIQALGLLPGAEGLRIFLGLHVLLRALLGLLGAQLQGGGARRLGLVVGATERAGPLIGRDGIGQLPSAPLRIAELEQIRGPRIQPVGLLPGRRRLRELVRSCELPGALVVLLRDLGPQQAEMALAADGKVLALRLRSLANVGAYATGTGVAIQLLIGPWVQTSVYDIQTIDFHFKAVLTNTASVAAYRGAGRPEAIYIMERLMDEAARQTGMDRVALRRRNFIAPSQMPYKNPMGQTYDTGQFEKVMDAGLAQADWNGFDARAARSRANGKLRGLGISTFLEWTGGNVFEERVTVDVKGDGTIEVYSAVNQMGQGIATTLAQLVVDVFGVPIERVKVVLGDTDRGDGFGSAGSRSLFTGGSAMRVGSERTIDHAKQLAAKELEASAEDIAYATGRFSVKGTDIGIDLFALAAKQPEGRIHMDSTSTVSGPTWPNGCHVSEVEVDPATGEVQIVAYSSVNDVGRVVNPMIVRGQLDGGAVQGIGQALQEHMVYDEGTGQPVTGSLMDYCAPRADVIAFEFVTSMDESTPCKNNPLGVKGVGELGTIGATPSIVNAVADALARAGRPELAPALQMPVTAAKLWGALSTRP
mgnify:CR=1 FL=1